MKKIGIIVAMDSEFSLVESLLAQKIKGEAGTFKYTKGHLDKKEIVLAKSGIGKVCAAVTTMEMNRICKPECIISTGVAGGIDEKLEVMDIVVGQRIVYHDVWCGEGNHYGQVQGLPKEFWTDTKLYKTAVGLCDKGMYGGLICSGDKFITDRAALNAIKNNFPEGLAVDMESGAIAQVCYMIGIPFLSFRVISDTPGKTQDHAQQYQDFWEKAPEKSFEVLQKLMEVL